MKKRAAILFCCLMLMCMTGCRDREAEFLKEAEIAEEEKREAEKGEEMISATPAKSQKEEKPSQKKEIYVDVCGAVAEPGVFRLPEGSRLFQAIEAAGGFLPEASETYLNRAKGLSDGEQIYVPTEKEALEMDKNPPLSSGEGDREVCEKGEGKVNLNTADETELCTLSGIGTSKAKAIIAYREKNGLFSSVEELMNVEGIKEGTFEKIKDEIEVG